MLHRRKSQDRMNLNAYDQRGTTMMDIVLNIIKRRQVNQYTVLLPHAESTLLPPLQLVSQFSHVGVIIRTFCLSLQCTKQVFQKLTALCSPADQRYPPPELGLAFHLCIILVNKIIQLGNPFKVLNNNREKLMELLWIFFFNKLMLVMFCGFLSAHLYHQGYCTHNNQS